MQLVMDINIDISLQPCRTNVHSGGHLCSGSIYGAHICRGPFRSSCIVVLVRMQHPSRGAQQRRVHVKFSLGMFVRSTLELVVLYMDWNT